MPGSDDGPEIPPLESLEVMCSYCLGPVMRGNDGRLRHTRAADAVFCSLITQNDHPRGRHA